MMQRLAIAAGLLAIVSAPAVAVGLGPLARDSVTDGPAKAFWLTVYNPYKVRREFIAYPAGIADGDAAPDAVDIRPARIALSAGAQRRILVIVRDIDPGETRRLRICAEPAQQEGLLHARVCSRLSARRVALAR